MAQKTAPKVSRVYCIAHLHDAVARDAEADGALQDLPQLPLQAGEGLVGGLLGRHDDSLVQDCQRLWLAGRLELKEYLFVLCVKSSSKNLSDMYFGQ